MTTVDLDALVKALAATFTSDQLRALSLGATHFTDGSDRTGAWQTLETAADRAYDGLVRDEWVSR